MLLQQYDLRCFQSDFAAHVYLLNQTADPNSPTFVDGPGNSPDGLSDEKWLEEWTRLRLNQEIASGQTKLFEDGLEEAPSPDPDIVT